MMNKYLQELKNNKIRDMWGTLQQPWSKVVDQVSESKSETFWRKSCQLLTVLLYEVEPSRWGVTFSDGADQTLFEQGLSAGNFEDAQNEASEMISEFICRGFEVLSGFSINMERPHNEVRFVQMVYGMEGRFYGLTKEGVLYVRTYPKGGGTPAWSPCNMTSHSEVMKNEPV